MTKKPATKHSAPKAKDAEPLPPEAVITGDNDKNYRPYAAPDAGVEAAEHLDHLIQELRQSVANGQHVEIAPRDAGVIADLLQDVANG